MYQLNISLALQAGKGEGLRIKCIFRESGGGGGAGLFPSVKSVCDLTFRGCIGKLLSAHSHLSKISHFCWHDIGSWFYTGVVCFNWNLLPFGFWGSSPKVPQHSLSSPAVFSLVQLSLNFQKDFANLLQLNIPLTYSGGYLTFKSHGLRGSSFQASFLCGSKRGSLWRCWLFFHIHNK